jgi:CBS domain-containing protein
MMRVTQLMHQPAITCDVEDTLHTAARLMWEHDCGVLPVVAGGRLAGVITDRDICMAAFTQGLPLSQIPVSGVMSADPLACGEDDTIEDAERRMGERQVRRVPVVDRAQQPIGVLSLNDITRDAAKARGGDGTQRRLVQTLGAICRPRRVEVGDLST